MAETDTKTPDTGKPGGKGLFKGKNKTPLIIAGVLGFFIIFYFIYRANQNSATAANAQTAATSGNVPADTTGAGTQTIYLQGPMGPTGPAGPEGPAGGTVPEPGFPPKGIHPLPAQIVPNGRRIKIGPLPAQRQPYPIRRYVVKGGQTSTDVAAMHGVSVSQLHAANAGLIGSASGVHPGQRLLIPAK